MRPVTKTGQGTYNYAVDVSGTQADLEQSLQGIKLSQFKGAAKPKVMKAYGTPTPTALQVLSGLDLIRQYKGTTSQKKKNKVAPLKAAQDTVTKRLAQMYGSANVPLQQMLGRYCSFCEMPILQATAVEHIVPKAPYPFFYIAWDNFLLACPVCNSNKLSKPPRSDTQFTPTPADEVGYFNTIKNTYLWPQWYKKVYQYTRPQLEYQWYKDGNWYPVTYPVAPGTELKTATVATRTITANVLTSMTTTKKGPVPKWQLNVPVRVQVVPYGPQGTKMVELAALNKPSGQTQSQADIRVWTRTQLWFTALGLLNIVKTAKAGTFDPFWQLMMASVPPNGLYSVWVTVIDWLGPNRSWIVPGTTTPVMKKFLDTIVGEGYFPGTDITDAP